MFAALSATNEAIMRAKSRAELFELVCAAAVLGGKFTSTTIALAEPGQDFLRDRRLERTKQRPRQKHRASRSPPSAPKAAD